MGSNFKAFVGNFFQRKHNFNFGDVLFCSLLAKITLGFAVYIHMVGNFSRLIGAFFK